MVRDCTSEPRITMNTARSYISAWCSFRASFFTSSQRNQFYILKEQVHLFCRTLKGVPQYLVVGGPVHSGKTTLILEVLCKLESQKQVPTILKIDSRSVTFRDVESFSSVVTSELQSWYERFTDKISGGVKGQIKFSDIDGYEISASGSFVKSQQQGLKSI